MPAYKDDGRWRWRRTIKLPTGKTKRGSGTPEINTRAAALEAEHAWIDLELKGKPTKVGETPTLQAIKDDYLDHLAMHRSPSLRANRESTFKAHLLPWFGPMRLDAITPAEVDAFKKAQLEKVDDEKLAPNTINNHVMSLTNALRWAHGRGLLPVVPKVEFLPRGSADDVEHLEADQLATVIASLAGDLRTMVIVAAYVGLRAGEMLALRWTDIDLARGRVRVKHNTYRGVDRPPKNKKARTVPLCRTAIEALKAHQHELGPLVFCHDDGSPIPYATALWRLQNATELTGWHVLRHTFGTRLSTAGVPLKAIQEWLGHASIKTTMVYAHYSPVLDSQIHLLDAPTDAENDSRQPGANPTTPSGNDQR